MTDIVERLRNPQCPTVDDSVRYQAADEIERLNGLLTDYHRVKELGRADAAEIKRLRADNERLMDLWTKDSLGKAVERLARALEQKP